MSELRILKVVELDKAWKELCKTDMMRDSFADIRLSLNVDDSEVSNMNFQSKEKRTPMDIII